MKKLLTFLTILLTCSQLTSCSNNEFTINICASEIPHKEILEGVVKEVLNEKGYDIKVTTLNWTLQNHAVANDEFDANYFQHIPYLNTYNGKAKIVPAAKVHYERLCLYTSNVNDKVIDNGQSIVIVNDSSNIERSLQLLVEKNILTINSSCYDENNNFTQFDTSYPNTCVTFAENYKNCSLTCVSENQLCVALNTFDFGIIPGNTALTGLKDYKNKICFGEEDESLISEKANIIAVKESNINNPKTIALVEALADIRVKEFIENTYGDTVIYNFENFLNNN